MAGNCFTMLSQPKVNLARRDVKVNETLCPLCKTESETMGHLIFTCRFSYKIWTAMYGWFGLKIALPNKPCAHFMQHKNALKKRDKKGVWNIMRFATVWNIWIWRNKVVFNGGQVNTESVFESIQLRSWHWIKAYAKGCYFSFSDWLRAPSLCLEQITSGTK